MRRPTDTSRRRRRSDRAVPTRRCERGQLGTSPTSSSSPASFCSRLHLGGLVVVGIPKGLEGRPVDRPDPALFPRTSVLAVSAANRGQRAMRPPNFLCDVRDGEPHIYVAGLIESPF